MLSPIMQTMLSQADDLRNDEEHPHDRAKNDDYADGDHSDLAFQIKSDI